MRNGKTNHRFHNRREAEIANGKFSPILFFLSKRMQMLIVFAKLDGFKGPRLSSLRDNLC